MIGSHSPPLWSPALVPHIGTVTSTEIATVATGGQLEQEMLAAPPPTRVGGVVLSTEAESQLEQGAITASAAEAASSQLPITEINAGTTKTLKKIKKHAPATNTTLRRSNHGQAKNDEHTLEKAARMAATRNLEGNQSFASFSDSRFSSNLDNIGVSLGRDDNVIRSSTIAIKNIEIDRLVVAAKKKVENKDKNNVKNKSASNITDFSDEKGEERREAVLNHVCGDINEDSLEQEYDHVFSDLNPIPRKKKSTSATKIKNGKPPKNPRTPSKLRL